AMHPAQCGNRCGSTIGTALIVTSWQATPPNRSSRLFPPPQRRHEDARYGPLPCLSRKNDPSLLSLPHCSTAVSYGTASLPLKIPCHYCLKPLTFQVGSLHS